LTDYASSQENEEAAAEANSTVAEANAICTDIEVDRYDTAYWPDLLGNKTTDISTERETVQYQAVTMIFKI
jgi:hypothetical protein